jgi:hypothetical protein
MNDEELHRLLRQHPASLPLPSAFEREVWSRIEADEVRSVPSILAELLSRLLTSLSRPAVAFATILTFRRSRCRVGRGPAKSSESKTRRARLPENHQPAGASAFGGGAMKRGILILVAAVAVGLCMFLCSRLMLSSSGPFSTKAMPKENGSLLPELHWLQNWLRLDAEQMQKVKALHLAYLPKCEDLCHRVHLSNEDILALSERSSHVDAKHAHSHG